MKKRLFLLLLALISACVPTVTPTPTPISSSTFTRTNTPSSTFTRTNSPSSTFTPSNTASPTRTNTPSPSATATPIQTSTFTPTLTVTPGPFALKYYLVDRVLNNADFATLGGWGINTAVISFDVHGDADDWQAILTSAANSHINIVIWPSDWTHPRPDCAWEAPYPVSANGDITRVEPLLDVASQYANFIGIVNAHESFWTCDMSFDEMAGLKTQLKAYALAKGRAIKVWNYINSLYSESMLPDAQIDRIMDVAVTWKHCAGGAEVSCDVGSNSALAMIQSNAIRAVGHSVELVYIIQTFTSASPYTVKFSLSQLESYSCEFIQTGDLQGFGFYTWDAGWWPDLHEFPELQPAVPYIKQNCTG